VRSFEGVLSAGIGNVVTGDGDGGDAVAAFSVPKTLSNHRLTTLSVTVPTTARAAVLTPAPGHAHNFFRDNPSRRPGFPFAVHRRSPARPPSSPSPSPMR